MKDMPNRITDAHSGNTLPVCVAVMLIVAVAVEPCDHLYAQFDKSDEQPSAAAEETDPNQTESEDASEIAVEEDLPLIGDLLADLPTVEQLLREPPVDWIVVKTRKDRVLIVEPIENRPGTLEKMQLAIEEFNVTPREPSESVEDWRQRFIDLHYLKLFVVGDATEYQLHMEEIDRIIHHEDQMLLRVDALLEERGFDDALQLLFALNRLNPDWPGASDRHNRLLFLESKVHFERGDAETALARLEQLHARGDDYPGLYAQLGTVADSLISTSVESDDFLQARHFLKRLQNLERNHSTARRWRQTFLDDATALMNDARSSSSQRDPQAACAAVEQAARIWPRAPGLFDLHQRLLSQFPRLHSGVLRLSNDSSGFPLPTAVEERIDQLTRIRLFELDSFDDVAHYRSRLFDHWEPTDLGRRSIFRLTQFRFPWESAPLLRSADIVEALSDRMNPSSQMYDDRLAAAVRSMKIRSPSEFELGFDQVPLRTEALLSFAVPKRSPESRPDRLARSALQGDALSQRFMETQRTDDSVVYRRVYDQIATGSKFHVAEVVEHRYATYDAAIQGLHRGEVSMLARLRPPHVGQISEDSRFFVQQSALPFTHVLQFHPQSFIVGSLELRRALAYGIDRRRLLTEIVLEGDDWQWARLVTAPFPSGHNAYDPLLEHRVYDRTLAYQLVAAARKRMQGNVPQLRMICEPDPIVEAVAREMIKEWSLIGIDIELLDTSSVDFQAGGAWDIVYRTVRMYEPVAQLWPFLTFDSRAQVDSLVHLPDWLRQELIELDAATDSTRARALLRTLHSHLYSQVHLIPMWEVDDFLVFRKDIDGFDVRPVAPYHGIERWTLKPWYPPTAP